MPIDLSDVPALIHHLYEATYEPVEEGTMVFRVAE
jgi:hypothetical protein